MKKCVEKRITVTFFIFFCSYLWVKKVSMHHSALYVIQVSIMFQRPLQETSLLTQLCHMGTIIVGEHLVAQNGICNLQDMT